MKKIIFTTILFSLFATISWAGKDRGGGSFDKIYGPATPPEFKISSNGNITILSYGQEKLSGFMLGFKTFIDYYEKRNEANEGIIKLTAFINNRLKSNGFEEGGILLANTKERISIEESLNIFIEVFKNVYSQLHHRLEYIINRKIPDQNGLFYFSNSCLDSEEISDASAINGEPNSYICINDQFKGRELSLSKLMGLVFHEYLRQYNVLVDDKEYLIEEHLFASIINLLWVDSEKGLISVGKCLLSYKIENLNFSNDRSVEHYWQFDPRDSKVELNNGSDIELIYEGAPFVKNDIAPKWKYIKRYNDYQLSYLDERELECQILRSNTAPTTQDSPYGHYKFTNIHN
jgi:hypothetical protein